MSRRYARLPPDDELVALWRSLDQRTDRTAVALGCSMSAVSTRLGRLGLRAPRVSVRARLERAEERLAEAQRRLDALEDRVLALEARPQAPRIIEIDHRRIADGGIGGRRSRRRALQSA